MLTPAGDTVKIAGRPNILLIVSDTLRRDHLGAYGNDWIHTPALDRLAAGSVVFDNHLAGSFPTMPARADLLTGRVAVTGGESPRPTPRGPTATSRLTGRPLRRFDVS